MIAPILEFKLSVVAPDEDVGAAMRQLADAPELHDVDAAIALRGLLETFAGDPRLRMLADRIGATSYARSDVEALFDAQRKAIRSLDEYVIARRRELAREGR